MADTYVLPNLDLTRDEKALREGYPYYNPELPVRVPAAWVTVSITYPSLLATTTIRNTEAEFARLAQRWKQETGHLSNVSKRCTHPAYQRIIGMGEPVIRFILRDLKETRDDWFWALTAITGENPIRAHEAGYVKKMTEAWLLWGREHDYDV